MQSSGTGAREAWHNKPAILLTSLRLMPGWKGSNGSEREG